MERFDFLRKELVRTYNYSTANFDRSGYIDYVENGRKYTKYGTWQAITYIGLLYKVYDTKQKMYKYVLHVGMSKQHPNDTRTNKDIAYEIAYENALIEPTITITWDQKPTSYDCMNIITSHLSNVKLKMMKTKEEIKLEKTK